MGYLDTRYLDMGYLDTHYLDMGYLDTPDMLTYW